MKSLVGLFILSISLSSSANSLFSCTDIGLLDTCDKISNNISTVKAKDGREIRLSDYVINDTILENDRVEVLETESGEVLRNSDLLNDGQIEYQLGTGIDGGGS